MQEKIGESIDYAIRTNEMEGLLLAEDDRAMLELVKRGEITLDEYGEAVLMKYKLLGQNKRITTNAALDLVRKEKDGK